MITINLKDFYPWYGQDKYIEVPEAVALELLADKHSEAAHRRKTRRNKVFSFSEYGEKDTETKNQSAPDPQEIVETIEQIQQLLDLLDSLSDVQSRRIRAHIILEMTLTETAAAENVSVAAVHRSIQRGLEKIRKFFDQQG